MASLDRFEAPLYEAPRFPEGYQPSEFEIAAAERRESIIAVNLSVLAGEQPSEQLKASAEHWAKVAKDLAQTANIRSLTSN